MYKTVFCVISLFVFGAVFATAANTTNLKHKRVVQAEKETKLSYAGLKLVIPAGNVVSLGKAKDKTVVIQADKMDGIKVDAATLSSQQPAVISVHPQEHYFTVLQGNDVQIEDAGGHIVRLSSGASVSGDDIRTVLLPSLPVVEKAAPIHPRKLAEMQKKAAREKQAAAEKTTSLTSAK